MIIALHVILCVIGVVGLFALFAIIDNLKDIQDYLQAIRARRVFIPKEENTVETCDVTSLHPSSIVSDESFGEDYSKTFERTWIDNRITANANNIREISKKLSDLEKMVNEHESKLNEIYIEE